VAGCSECGDEPSGSCATEFVTYNLITRNVCTLRAPSASYDLRGRLDIPRVKSAQCITDKFGSRLH
jgi:hypothetical protein